MVFNIDLGIATLVLTLIGIAVAILINDVFGKYEKKISQIKTALLGFLQTEVNRLVNKEIDYRELKTSTQINLETSEQEEYRKLITFFRESHLFIYANDYEDMLDSEKYGDGKINKLAYSIGAFAVPVILLQQEGSMYNIGILSLFLNFMFFVSYFSEVKNMICNVKKLYNKYIIENQSFGGYDL